MIIFAKKYHKMSANTQDTTQTTPKPEENLIPELRILESMVSWSDNKFKLPVIGTRFGLDPIVSAIPYLGDIVGFGVSGIFLLVMVRHGVKFSVLFKMLGNIFVDAVAGSFPIVGDIFDIGFKANHRNLNLLKQHYGTGQEHLPFGKAAMIIVVIGAVMAFAIFSVVVWATLHFGSKLWALLAS
jgi:hypothetical protein